MNMKKGIIGIFVPNTSSKARSLLKSSISRIPLGFSNFPMGRNKILLCLIFVLLIPVVSSSQDDGVECSQAVVVNFNYDNGVIKYKDKVIKCGYAPDRALQPGEGYIAEMIDINNEVVYSFKFEVPLKVNFDSVDPLIKSLSGGYIELNETDFALIFPYYDEVKSIVVYNPRKYRILEVPLIEERLFFKRRSFWWVLVLAVLVIGAYLKYKQIKKKKRDIILQQQRAQYYRR
jgi:hypothetical protein